MNRSKNQKGAVLITCMLLLCVFAALAVGTATIADTNLQIAVDQTRSNRALESAFSGLEYIRFQLAQVVMPKNTLSKFDNLAGQLDINIGADYDGSDTVTISAVTLDSATGQSFSALIYKTADPNRIQVDITGNYKTLTRTIRVNYDFGPRRYPIFNFGVATRGPLSLTGNIELDGTNIAVESDVYIESSGYEEALSIIGNSQIAGDVKIINPDAYVTLQGGQAGIGGEIGQDAIDNHVSIGELPVVFPPPDPGYFEQYVQSVIDTNETVFENVRIPPDTNPTFSDATFKGVVFIEVPNVVTFTGNTSITGIIIGNGDVDDNSGTNQINFIGNVDSYPVTDLPETEPQFDELRSETGTFLMAPGFSASFGGSFDTLNGAIAANGIEFFGDAGGTIEGSVLNYSGEPMTLTGNSDLFFTRTDATKTPAGFDTELVLNYDPDSYSEPIL